MSRSSLASKLSVEALKGEHCTVSTQARNVNHHAGMFQPQAAQAELVWIPSQESVPT